MKSFQYTIQDAVGIHARPAGLLVQEAKKFESTVTVKKEAKGADARKIMALMGLGVKCGQEVTVEVEGPDEDQACEALRVFFEKNL